MNTITSETAALLDFPGPQSTPVCGTPNRDAILRLLRQKPGSSRIDISEELGIVAPTISTEVKIMIGQGLIYETGTVRAGRGRPKTRLAISEDVAMCGIEISGKGVTAALVDLNGRVLTLERTYYSPGLGNLTQVLRRLLQDGRTRLLRVEALGVTLGENLCLSEKFAWDSHRVPSAELKAGLQKAIGLPVEIESEMRAIMVGERMFGGLADVESSAIIDVSDDIRVVMAAKGKLHSAVSRMGEIAHLVIDPNGPACSCGQKGCLAAIASSGAVLDSYCRAARVNPLSISIFDFYERVMKRDADAVKIFQVQAEALARALHTLTLMTVPEVILLMGPMVNFWNETGPLLKKAMQTVSGNCKIADIRHNSYPEQMRIRGAAAVALSRAELRWS